MRSLSILPSTLIALGALTGCGVDGSRSHMAGVDWDVDLTVTEHTVTISYRVTNTQTRPLVVYNRGWVVDPANPRPAELEATDDDIQIVVDGDVTELGLRIIDTCHGNPDGELTHADTGKRRDCGAGSTDPARIAATTLELGEELVQSFDLDVDALRVDYPTELAGTVPDLTGPIRFCVGVHRTAKPAPDGLYPPDAKETILCARA